MNPEYQEEIQKYVDAAVEDIVAGRIKTSKQACEELEARFVTSSFVVREELWIYVLLESPFISLTLESALRAARETWVTNREWLATTVTQAFQSDCEARLTLQPEWNKMLKADKRRTTEEWEQMDNEADT